MFDARVICESKRVATFYGHDNDDLGMKAVLECKGISAKVESSLTEDICCEESSLMAAMMELDSKS